MELLLLLANVRYMSSSVRLASVCNVCAPYSGDWNFGQCFYAIWYAGHLL